LGAAYFWEIRCGLSSDLGRGEDKYRSKNGPVAWKLWTESHLGRRITVSAVRDCGERQLYLLDQGAAGLSTEFVIKLETTNGQVYYDNNAGTNYKLEANVGRGTSAVAGDGAIWSFAGFVHYHLLQRT
jgi:hypothetical protein